MSALSSYKNYLGLAKVATTAVGHLTASVAAAGTSLTVDSLGGASASSSVIIMDGPLTEVKAVSAATGSTITVAALANAHPAGTLFFVQPTASVGATTYTPLRTFKVPDKVNQLYDLSRRNALVKQVGAQQGLRDATWQFDGDVFPDTIGYFLGGLCGASDFTGGTPNTHAFSVLNSGNGQPTYYAFYVYDGVNTRVILGRIQEVALKYDPKALLSHSTKVLAHASGVVANAGSGPSYSALPPAATWRSSLTVGGTYTREPLTFDLTLTREEAENIATMMSTQDPFDTFVGPLVGTGKVSFVKEDDSHLADYLSGNLETLVVSFTQGTGATQVGLTIQMTSANYDQVEPMLQGKAYNTEDGSFTLVANSTDATTAGGGIAPCKITLTNAVASGSYT